MPAVVIATEAFTHLLNVVLKARQAPESMAIIIAGNPEIMNPLEVDTLADHVLDDAVRQLAGTPRVSQMVGVKSR